MIWLHNQKKMKKEKLILKIPLELFSKILPDIFVKVFFHWFITRFDWFVWLNHEKRMTSLESWLVWRKMLWRFENWTWVWLSAIKNITINTEKVLKFWLRSRVLSENLFFPHKPRKMWAHISPKLIKFEWSHYIFVFLSFHLYKLNP